MLVLCPLVSYAFVPTLIMCIQRQHCNGSVHERRVLTLTLLRSRDDSNCLSVDAVAGLTPQERLLVPFYLKADENKLRLAHASSRILSLLYCWPAGRAAVQKALLSTIEGGEEQEQARM